MGCTLLSYGECWILGLSSVVSSYLVKFCSCAAAAAVTQGYSYTTSRLNQWRSSGARSPVSSRLISELKNLLNDVDPSSAGFAMWSVPAF